MNLPLINDTSRWIKLTHTFATSGNENYFSIGCFDPEGKARTKKVKPSLKIKQQRKESYYFIGNISICPVEEDEEELRIPKSPVKLYIDMLRTPTAFDTIVHEGFQCGTPKHCI